MKPLAAMIVFLPALAASAAVPGDCWAMRGHGHEAQARECFTNLTLSSNASDRAEGFWGLEQWQQANTEFRLATTPADSKPIYKVRWGLLLHQRFNDSDAASLFKEALDRDQSLAEAYIGLARISAEGFSGEAAKYLAKAIELSPKSAEPHEILANLALTNDDREQARAEADKAIALSSDAVDAYAIRAALELIADRSPDVWFAKIRAVNPIGGEPFERVANQLEMHYRYEDAVTYYRMAVAAQPNLWSAHSALGIDLMRLGQQDEPYKELELAYSNDYRNAATVNSLRLLDSYKNFETIRDSSTIIKLNKSESALLLPYIQNELHTILATYTKKYEMTLLTPVQVEVYPDHEDFAVRTMGMPGLGALGVTFGEVVAMDSPSARKPGDFNWGATLWHEMSHVFTLTATNHRIPRWFTEGLAVHEEGQRSAEWKNRATPDIIAAIRDNKLLPIEKLDRGFVFPDYPAQVIVSYFQAGTICDFVGEKWGEPKLLDMIHSYAKLAATPEVIQQDLGLSTEEFDKQYLAWLEKQYSEEAQHLDEWRGKLRELVASSEHKDYPTVLKQGPAVIALYPQYVDDANAYELLAVADKALGNEKAEAAILADYEHAGGQSPDALKRLAELEAAAGGRISAIATLERINYIYPVKDEVLHRRLGDLYYAQSNFAAAEREYGAVIASNPMDRAGAEFALAQAYFAAGDKDKAQSSVLDALEAAPGYRPAQKLLLELQTLPTKSN